MAWSTGFEYYLDAMERLRQQLRWWRDLFHVNRSSHLCDDNRRACWRSYLSGLMAFRNPIVLINGQLQELSWV